MFFEKGIVMINRVETEVSPESKGTEVNFGFDTVGLPASVKPFGGSAKAKLVEFLVELAKAIEDGRITSYGAIGAASRTIEQIAIECSGKRRTAIDGIEYGRDVWSDEVSSSATHIVESQRRFSEDLETNLAALKAALNDIENS